jgi:chitinase
VKDEDGSVQTHFLNGAHANNLADVEAPGIEAAVAAAAAAANLTQYWGQQIAFKDIVKSGALAKKSDGTYGQAGGFTMAWDNCSDTPVRTSTVRVISSLLRPLLQFLFNKAQTTVVTYDGMCI